MSSIDLNITTGLNGYLLLGWSGDHKRPEKVTCVLEPLKASGVTMSPGGHASPEVASQDLEAMSGLKWLNGYNWLEVA